MDFKKKLQAFFHDPLNKPLQIEGHESRVSKHLEIFGLEYKKDETADHIASAADRLSHQDLGQVDFKKDGEITHPLGSGRILLTEQRQATTEEPGTPQVKLYLKIDLDDNEQAVEEFFQKVNNRNNKEDEQSRYKQIFIDIWRNFPEELFEVEQKRQKVGSLWNLLPADTRIPDHSVLTHNLLCSALSSCGNSPVVTRIAIGPVQGFISQARRTEDLWAGSYILSWLISRIIGYVITTLGPDHLIYPNVKYQPLIDHYLAEEIKLIEVFNRRDVRDNGTARAELSLPSLPNVLFLLLPPDEFRSHIEAMKEKLHESWENLCDAVKTKYLPNLSDYHLEEVWNRQIKDLIEFHWAAVETKDKEQLETAVRKVTGQTIDFSEKKQGEFRANIGTYWENITELNGNVLQAAKAIRAFNRTEDEGEKCTLCGERVALSSSDSHTSENYYRELREFWEKVRKQPEVGPARLDSSERLCAVCFVKRFARPAFFSNFLPNNPFPSTSTIASIPWRLRLLDELANGKPELKDTLKNNLERLKPLTEQHSEFLPLSVHKRIKKTCSRLEEDLRPLLEEFLHSTGHFYYKENLEEKVLREYGIEDDARIKDIQDAIANIQKKLKEPERYYAVLAMDGDNMGKWITGKLHAEGNGSWPELRDVLHTKTIKHLEDQPMKIDLSERVRVRPSTHSFISLALGEFTRQVFHVVEEEFSGKLIYAGGDDVLAMVPLGQVLCAAEKLRFFFTGQLDKNRKIDLAQKAGFFVDYAGRLVPTMGAKASLSAGIAIVHYSFNLQEAIRLAHRELKLAKSRLGRDACRICVARRSGSHTCLGFKWRTEAGERVIPKIEKILGYVRDDSLGMSFFSSSFEAIAPIEDEVLIRNLLKTEIRRHSQQKDLKSILPKELEEIFSAIPPMAKESDQDIGRMDSFKNLFLLIRFLAAHSKEASKSKERKDG